MPNSQFIYLLNAMEGAAQSENPFERGYADKRRAVLEYVAKLESTPRSESERSALVKKVEAFATLPDGWNSYGEREAVTVGEAICIKDWHIQAENGDRQECLRGKAYTITQPQDGNEDVTLFSGFWVKAPKSIFAGWVSLRDLSNAASTRTTPKCR